MVWTNGTLCLGLDWNVTKSSEIPTVCYGKDKWSFMSWTEMECLRGRLVTQFVMINE